MNSWLDIESRMRALLEPLRDMRLDVQWGGSTGEGWRLAGIGRSQALAEFELLCGFAGNALLTAFEGDPDRPGWLDDTNAMQRWFRAIKQWSGAFENFNTFYEVYEDETKTPVYTGSISRIAEVSATLCLQMHLAKPLEAAIERRKRMAPNSTQQQLDLILIVLKEMQDAGNNFVDDQNIAEKIGASCPDIQDYLEILEQQNLIEILRPLDGFVARLTALGRIRLKDPDFQMQNNPSIKIDLSGSSNVIVNAGSTLNSVSQVIDASSNIPAGDKENLKAIINQLHESLRDVPDDYAEDVETIVESTKIAVEQLDKPKPNKAMLAISADGLKAAAKNLASVAPTVFKAAMEIVSMLSDNPPSA